MPKRGQIVVAVVGVLLLVLLLVSPYVIGVINENAVRNGIERYSAQPTMQASVIDYDRGWLSSLARMEFGIDPEYLSDVAPTAGDPIVTMLGDFKLPVIAEFEHGPILRRNGFGLGTSAIHAYVDPESEIAQLAGLLGMPYVIDFRGRGSLGLGFDYEGEIPPAMLAMQEVSFEFSGVEFGGSFDSGGRSVNGKLDSLAIQSLFFSAILEAAGIESDLRRSGPGQLPLGDSTFSIGRLAISDPFVGAESSFTASNMSLTSSVVENDDDDFVDIGLAYAVDSLTVGTDIAINDARFGINFEHLDAEAVSAFYDAADTGKLVGDPEELIAELMPVLEQLLAGAPVMSIDPLGFSMPEGNASGRVTISLDPAAIPPGGVLDPAVMASAMQSAAINFDLTASKTLVSHLAQLVLLQQTSVIDFGIQGQVVVPPEQAAANARAQADLVLLMLSTQGLITDNGDNWSTSISIENGRPMANGQPLLLGL